MTFRSRIYTTGALAAVLSGLLRVVRAPLLLIGVYVLTVIAVLPFAIVLGSQLQDALASQQVMHDPAHDIDADIDAEWWLEFNRHARGLAATFTPAIVGAAAPLSAVSAMLDGEMPPLAVLAPVGLYAALWAFLWGGVLQRLQASRRIGIRAFMAASARHFFAFLILALVAAVIYALLYATVHATLFGPVFSALRDAAGSERVALAWRVVLYLVFGSLLLAITLLVDYTRVFAVRTGTPLRPSFYAAASFVRARLVSAAGAHVLLAILLGAILAGYAIVDVLGGARVGGWRAVVLGQAFVLGRLGLRLALAGAAVSLVAGDPSAGQRSIDEANPGPPAAT